MENITLIPPNTTHQFTVCADQAGQRIDLYLKKQLPSYSRSFLKQLILQEMVSINSQKNIKPRTLTKQEDLISITFPPPTLERPQKEIPQNLNVKIVYQDTHFMIINKPYNLVVHPPKITSEEITLVDWLTHKFQDIDKVGYADRPGIVHRLDKDTSGIMIVACNNCAHAILGDMFRNRTVQKTYLAIVEGHPNKKGTIEFGIKRNPFRRNSMTHVKLWEKKEGLKIREAFTNYEVLEYFENHSLVEVKPVTGRTHQIRVHFSAIGHPLVGDQLYGKKSKLIKRHALHAHQLSFKFNGKQHNFSQKPPMDFLKIIEILRNN